MGMLRDFRKQHGLTRARLLDRLPLHLKYVQEYRSVHGKTCLLLRPKTFNEKIFYKMLHDCRPLLATFADKLLAREYVRRTVGGEILVDLLAVSDRPEDLPFEQLPRQFMLKANHGSGFTRVVHDRLLEDKTELCRTCQKWLSVNYGKLTGEWVYQDIHPQIMVERLLVCANGQLPGDYKFFVFNGKVFMIQVDVDQFADQRRNFYSADWKQFDVRCLYPNADRPMPRPANLERMLAIAERLGAETDFVRVDLYDVDGRIFFGELTNFPGRGCRQYDPKDFDAVLGKPWRITGY
jgi:hypothetical protein